MDALARRRRIEALERLCREGGLPLTVQRRAILEAVLARGDHPTADQVFDDVRRRLADVSRATVYRTLDTLVRLDVVSEAALPGPATRYDRRVERHHHLVCLRCRRAIDVVDERLDALRLPDTSRRGFDVIDFSVQMRGLCRSCRGRGREAGRSRPAPRRTRPKAR
jgi:Fur family peroxide stress response transcriptional regulator